MPRRKKNEVVKLPIEITMTEEGENYFFHINKQLSRIRLVDGTEERGLHTNAFMPKQIQSMIINGHISRIEISRVQYSSVREELMDLSKAIVYTYFYKKFNQELFYEMLLCECVIAHNRANPSLLFDDKTNIPIQKVKEINAKNKATITMLTKEILTPVWKHIKESQEYEPEEKELYMLMSNKFMAQIDALTWFMIMALHRKEDFNQIVAILHKLLYRYLKKSRIAEFIALMVMELALNNENENIRKAILKKHRRQENVNKILRNPEERAKIISEMEERKAYSYISYKMSGGIHSIGKQGRFQITLYNQSEKFNALKEHVESKRNLELSKKPLTDFYHTLSEEDQADNLGFYYLSYLNEECKIENIKFESFVNQFNSAGLTVINLIFNI